VHIAIDARKLHDYGIGTYIRNLLRQLARIDAASTYHAICSAGDAARLAELGPNMRPVPTTSRPESFGDQLVIPALLRRVGAQVYHTPYAVLPLARVCPSVVTMHDCVNLTFPQYAPSHVRQLMTKARMWSAAHRSARILTVSEASKRDILKFFDVPPDKVSVIPNAIDDCFSALPPADEVQRVRERYQLDGEFVLYVGNIRPHKNLVRLIEALYQLRESSRFENLRLLIIGDEISKYPTLRRAVHRHKLHKHVRFFGFVPDRTLAVLYRLATVFVFPSLYEGFGLPPLEAMASGTPVVTSNVSSLPEVVGDAALLIDPYDPAAIAEGIRVTLTDEALRARLISAGLARARAFSWETSVRRVREVYGEVARQ
jgi:glycosyltransferase involved in cell wall biosynthesis